MRNVYGIQVLLFMLTTSILAVAPVRSQEKKPVVIAIPVGLSGVNSVVAPAVVQSAELAADELNAKGGILGRPVKVVPLDDESGPAGAVKAFNTGIHQDKSDVIITMETSAARNAGAPSAERAENTCSSMPGCPSRWCLHSSSS